MPLKQENRELAAKLAEVVEVLTTISEAEFPEDYQSDIRRLLRDLPAAAGEKA